MPPPPLPLLWCCDIHPHPGLLRVAQANVTSLRMPWLTVAEWQVHVVLLSEIRPTAESREGEHMGCAGRGWPRDHPGARRTHSPNPRGTTPGGAMSWSPLGGDWSHCMPRRPTPSPPSRPPTGLFGTRPPSARRPLSFGWDLNFDLDRLLRAPPSVLADLQVHWLVDEDLELRAGPRFLGLQGTRPSRIDGIVTSRRRVAPARGHPWPHPGALRFAPEGGLPEGGEVRPPQAKSWRRGRNMSCPPSRVASWTP